MPEAGPPPYRPPPIGVPDRGRLQVRPVAIGLAVDWLGTLVASFLIAVFAVAIAAARGQDQAGAEEYLEQLAAAPDFVIVSSLIGLGMVALGGAVTAWLAAGDRLRHAAVMGVASLFFGLGMDWVSTDSQIAWRPLWFATLGHALVVPAALLGGAFAERLRGAPTTTPDAEPPE